MMDYCPKVEKEVKKADRVGQSIWNNRLEDLMRSKNGYNGRSCAGKPKVVVVYKHSYCRGETVKSDDKS